MLEPTDPNIDLTPFEEAKEVADDLTQDELSKSYNIATLALQVLSDNDLDDVTGAIDGDDTLKGSVVADTLLGRYYT